MYGLPKDSSLSPLTQTINIRESNIIGLSLSLFVCVTECAMHDQSRGHMCQCGGKREQVCVLAFMYEMWTSIKQLIKHFTLNCAEKTKVGKVQLSILLPIQSPPTHLLLPKWMKLVANLSTTS